MKTTIPLPEDEFNLVSDYFASGQKAPEEPNATIDTLQQGVHDQCCAALREHLFDLEGTPLQTAAAPFDELMKQFVSALSTQTHQYNRSPREFRFSLQKLLPRANQLNQNRELRTYILYTLAQKFDALRRKFLEQINLEIHECESRLGSLNRQIETFEKRILELDRNQQRTKEEATEYVDLSNQKTRLTTGLLVKWTEKKAKREKFKDFVDGLSLKKFLQGISPEDATKKIPSYGSFLKHQLAQYRPLLEKNGFDRLLKEISVENVIKEIQDDSRLEVQLQCKRAVEVPSIDAKNGAPLRRRMHIGTKLGMLGSIVFGMALARVYLYLEETPIADDSQPPVVCEPNSADLPFGFPLNLEKYIENALERNPLRITVKPALMKVDGEHELRVVTMGPTNSALTSLNYLKEAKIYTETTSPKEPRSHLLATIRFPEGNIVGRALQFFELEHMMEEFPVGDFTFDANGVPVPATVRLNIELEPSKELQDFAQANFSPKEETLLLERLIDQKTALQDKLKENPLGILRNGYLYEIHSYGALLKLPEVRGVTIHGTKPTDYGQEMLLTVAQIERQGKKFKRVPHQPLDEKLKDFAKTLTVMIETDIGSFSLDEGFVIQDV